MVKCSLKSSAQMVSQIYQTCRWTLCTNVHWMSDHFGSDLNLATCLAIYSHFVLPFSFQWNIHNKFSHLSLIWKASFLIIKAVFIIPYDRILLKEIRRNLWTWERFFYPANHSSPFPKFADGQHDTLSPVKKEKNTQLNQTSNQHQNVRWQLCHQRSVHLI